MRAVKERVQIKECAPVRDEVATGGQGPYAAQCSKPELWKSNSRLCFGLVPCALLQYLVAHTIIPFLPTCYSFSSSTPSTCDELYATQLNERFRVALSGSDCPVPVGARQNGAPSVGIAIHGCDGGDAASTS